MKNIKAVLAVLTVFAMLLLSSCFAYSSFDEIVSGGEATTAYEYRTTSYWGETEQSVIPEITTAVQIPPQVTQPQETQPQETQPQVTQPQVTQPQVTQPQTEITTAPVQEEISYTKAEIINIYSEALNKTRGYTGALTVNHSESFTADIKDAHPGGALTELLASNIVKLVGSEGQQTLSYNGGTAVNKDGETVPILLPQRTSFSLPESGVADASLTKTGDKTRIRLVLVPETVTMGQVPPYNAGAIGYLDTSDMDFKIITISRVDITYPGSVIDAVIRADGYIESVTYTINMSTYAELSGMGISGYGTLEGAQTEKWNLIW